VCKIFLFTTWTTKPHIYKLLKCLLSNCSYSAKTWCSGLKNDIIANGKIDGEYMPYRELVSYYTIVATAGHETTRTAMAGGLLALLENPNQMDLLREGSTDILKLAVEEMIRWSTPVTQFCRTATQDVKLRGKDIKAGDNLGLFYASANRDEDVFDQPETFRVGRRPNKHLAFGLGPHMCLGNILARMELRIFFEQLIPRIDEMEIIGDPDYLQASFVHGLKHLPIRYRLRPRPKHIHISRLDR